MEHLLYHGYCSQQFKNIKHLLLRQRSEPIPVLGATKPHPTLWASGWGQDPGQGLQSLAYLCGSSSYLISNKITSKIIFLTNVQKEWNSVLWFHCWCNVKNGGLHLFHTAAPVPHRHGCAVDGMPERWVILGSCPPTHPKSTVFNKCQSMTYCKESDDKN